MRLCFLCDNFPAVKAKLSGGHCRRIRGSGKRQRQQTEFFSDSRDIEGRYAGIYGNYCENDLCITAEKLVKYKYPFLCRKSENSERGMRV